MARIHLEIDEPAQRMTLRAMLEAQGHVIGIEEPEVVFCDSVSKAIAQAKSLPTLVLATASEIPDAVRAMREGVAGYVFLPLQPGEAADAVQQALSRASDGAPASGDTPEGMRTLAEIELEYIQSVLRKCGNNQARAARVLGIGRNTLWRKLKKSSEVPAGGAAD